MRLIRQSCIASSPPQRRNAMRNTTKATIRNSPLLRWKPTI